MSARFNTIEINWFHLQPLNGTIILTDREPTPPYYRHQVTSIEYLKSAIQTLSQENSEPVSSSSTEQTTANLTLNQNLTTPKPQLVEKTIWTYGPENRTALYTILPREEEGWETTNIPFDTNLLNQITAQTKCYGYWAVYLTNEGDVVTSACISAYATWMNDMRDHIKKFRFRDLFIVGSHDSGSFRSNFNPRHNETLVTKYSLTQVSAFETIKK